ncbi:hypothetical protein Acsp04_61080 [Actinomadura sp. NBRC 104425]|uniref:BTAD domain-containing putative transcriptional regulator n=1 Tax=Actinomadura sp. NBRC 104425 TaxID=3032204 RepID=UPI0024A5D64C|nr:BTAD domain-containing putative transcriptional regulator [Actinomadura sp. NBRC 104425]GLZ15873.1 hypothetical protein Acsp04_61080 [Actinomadura sp. NBRC 104425]
MTRTAEIWRGIGAFIVLASLLVGFPFLLYVVGGSPIPDHLPAWPEVASALMRPDDDHALFLSAVRLIGWSAWLLFAVLIGTETVGYLAGRPGPHLPRPVRPAQLLARDLVAMAALLFTASTALTSSVGSLPAHAVTAEAEELPAPSPSFTSDASTHPQAVPTTEPSKADAKRPSWRTRTIKRGDTLWDIARRHYGSGRLYPRIFKASRDLDQPTGVPLLRRPSLIYPGQRIRIPLDTRTTTAPQQSRDQPTDAPKHADAAPTGSQKATQAPASDARQPNPVARRPTTSAPAPSASASTGPQPHDSATPPPSGQTASTVTLPSGTRIGLGLAAALSLALAMTRLHRRRRRPLNHEQWPSATTPDPAPPAAVAKAHKTHLDMRAEHGEPIPSDIDLVTTNQNPPTPDHITVGTLRGNAVTLPLPGLSIGLDGDGAASAIRAITTELLAKARRDRVELLIPEHDVRTLYPSSDIIEVAAGLPGLTITPTLNAAITHLETEIIRRARLLETADAPDLPSLRTADPGEPLPALLVVASVPDECSHRLHTVIQLGHRHGIGALVHGPWPQGTTTNIADNGTITNAHGPHADLLTGTHLFHLTADDAADMLQTLRTATGKPDPTPPQRTDRTPPPPTPVPPRPQADQAQQSLVQLLLLGPTRLRTTGGPIDTGLRRSSKGLLAYLALHPDGITRDQGSAALWPDHEPDNAATMFHTAVSNIRKVLRHATGLREPMFILHAAGRYRLDPHLIHVDVWRLSALLQQAHQATDDAARIDALRPLTNLYTGDFATDLTEEWAEAHREYLRRTAVDALAHLAHLTQNDHPDQALATLEQALRHDPYSEPLYRSIMQLQARLDRPDAVRRTYQLLTTRLAELDTEPDDETHRLLTRLRHQHSDR